MRRLRVLVLMHPDFVPPDSTEGYTARQINEWKTEYDVVSTLRATGHDVRPLGAQEENKPVREAIENFKPHVVFTLLEQFHNEPTYDQHVASYLELMKIRSVTVTGPAGDEEMERLLRHHGVKALFIAARQPLFGLPLAGALMDSSFPVAAFDWSFGQSRTRRSGLAIDPSLPGPAAAHSIREWFARV